MPDDEREGEDQVVILTHRLWQRRYAGDPQILGSTVRIDDRPFTVIGIWGPVASTKKVPESCIVSSKCLNPFLKMRS